MAVELLRHSDSRLDLPQLTLFLNSYQRVAPLTHRRAVGVAEHAEAGADREPAAPGRRDPGEPRARAAPPTRTSRARRGAPDDAGARFPMTRTTPTSCRCCIAPASTTCAARRCAPRSSAPAPRARWPRTSSAPSTSGRPPARPRWPTPSPACGCARPSTGASTSRAVSLVEKVLRRDPAGVYARMDFLSRDRQRQAVEELAEPTARRRCASR